MIVIRKKKKRVFAASVFSGHLWHQQTQYSYCRLKIFVKKIPNWFGIFELVLLVLAVGTVQQKVSGRTHPIPQRSAFPSPQPGLPKANAFHHTCQRSWASHTVAPVQWRQDLNTWEPDRSAGCGVLTFFPFFFFLVFVSSTIVHSRSKNFLTTDTHFEICDNGKFLLHDFHVFDLQISGKR